MLNPPPRSDREWLEYLYQKSPSVSVVFQFQTFFRGIWQALKLTVTRNPHHPRVSRYFDVNGVVIWHVYDPVSKRNFTSRSEQEVSAWLEQCYSHQLDA